MGSYRCWVVIVSDVFYGCGVVCVLLFAKENGFSPGFLGTPMSVPTGSFFLKPRWNAVQPAYRRILHRDLLYTFIS
jgi:hypothetical protein